MTDPISMIGLVSGIITFIDFSLKVLSENKKLRDSARRGNSDSIDDLEQHVKIVQNWNQAVLKQQHMGLRISEDEARILDAVRRCQDLAKELQRAIETLKVQHNVRSTTIEHIRVAFQRRWRHNDVQNLQSRLQILEKDIRTHVDSALMRKSNSAIMTKLRQLETSQEAENIKELSHLSQIREDILKLTKQTNDDMQRWDAAQAARLTNLCLKFEVLMKEQRSCEYQIEVLRSLHFSEIHKRWYNIKTADQRSNEWIYDSERTLFTSWLESKNDNDAIFYITGKAGSGKSTLMKFISENSQTVQYLKTWAGSSKLYRGSYYFWNQGTDMQKSGVGLFQSLLYKILRAAPELIGHVCCDRLAYEPWTMEELYETFKRTERETRADAKFCFFIDGLDEYEGEEKEIIHLLKALTLSNRIKICVSSRPGRQYEVFLPKEERVFDIAHFTQDDMRRHTELSLTASANWLNLMASNEKSCQELIEEISARASGVWLWVYLVTKDIVKEAERSETLETLYDIVAQTPENLEEYFEIMIGKIAKRHREDMAKIFLTVVEEVQPLPLYAFALLEQEKNDNMYALKAPVKVIEEHEIEFHYSALKDRVRNRCSDLLVVDDEPHPVFLKHSVDFLHRTVRDFLREYDLRKYLKDDSFDPLLSLSRICLGLLKGLRVDHFQDIQAVNRVIGLTDEILYYAREAERRCKAEDYVLFIAILDEVDKVNCHHARDIRNHWTQARDSPRSRGFDEYKEGGNCNFLGLAIQARLVKYVRAKLMADPKRMTKPGRPLLDYALRPRRLTPINMPYHHMREDPSISVDMVELLLSPNLGADPNQPVRLNGDRSVWALFLLSIRETHDRESREGNPNYPSLNRAWYLTCLRLIRAGARSTCLSSGSRHLASGHVRIDPEEVPSILSRVFGNDRAAELVREMEEKESERPESKCRIM